MGYCNNDRARWLAAHIMPIEPLMRAWLRRVRPPGLEIDDLIQEAYAKLSSLPSVAHITEPKPYLFRVVKSLILGHLRHARVVRIESMAELDELAVSAEEASPERIVSGRQQLEQLVHAIERLPSGCRQVLSLRKFEELSQKQIAMKMGISENTVEKQLARAVRLLLVWVAEEEQETVPSSHRNKDGRLGKDKNLGES